MAPIHRLAIDEGAGRRHRGRGQALVEFALLFPVFLLLTVGVVDFGRVFSSYISLTNAVREGALYAGTCTSTSCGYESSSNMLTVMQHELADLTAGDVTCRVGSSADMSGATACSSASAFSGFVRVDGSFAVPLVTPVVGNIFGGSVQLSASAVASLVTQAQ